MCHSRSKHYELKGCTACHNPHQPLAVVLKGDITEPCLTCHSGEGEELAAYPSKHGQVSSLFSFSAWAAVVPEPENGSDLYVVDQQARTGRWRQLPYRTWVEAGVSELSRGTA